MRYLFDEYVLDPARRELRRADVRVELEPQVFDLLEFLVRARDRVITRDDMLQIVWKGRIVSDSTMSSRINAARVAVGDSGAEQRLIRTLPRKGVRFVGAVREEADEVAEAPSAAPAVPRAAPASRVAPSIAVLPFTNMSGDPSDEDFADGISEEITTGLAQCSGLVVVARNSAFAFKGRHVDMRHIGAELGADYVLEGSVRRSGDLLRITAQLIDAATGAHLWADRIDGDPGGAFELQDRITRHVVAVIEPKLLFAEAARSRSLKSGEADAYDLYLRALSLIGDYTPEATAAALDCLDRALELAPNHAQAMAASACYRAFWWLQGWKVSPSTGREVGIQLASRAVALAPNDAQVLWMAAFAIWVLAKDRPRARDLFSRSLAINRNSEIALTLAGWVEAANGDSASGRALIEEAAGLNPTPPMPWVARGGMAFSYLVEGACQEAALWAERALAQNADFAIAEIMLAVALVQTGDIARARRIAAHILEARPETDVAEIFERLPYVAEGVARIFRESLQRATIPDCDTVSFDAAPSGSLSKGPAEGLHGS